MNMTLRDVWVTKLRAPAFIFGPKNRVFKEYVEAIIKNDETKRILELGHWEDNPIYLIDPTSEKYGRAFDKRYHNERLEEESREDNAFVRDPDRKTQIVRNIQYIKLLAKGTKIEASESEATIPVIKHSDIKPLRWCHAECALVPTKRSLNVLFFETGDEDPPSPRASEGQSKKENT